MAIQVIALATQSTTDHRGTVWVVAKCRCMWLRVMSLCDCGHCITRACGSTPHAVSAWPRRGPQNTRAPTMPRRCTQTARLHKERSSHAAHSAAAAQGQRVAGATRRAMAYARTVSSRGLTMMHSALAGSRRCTVRASSAFVKSQRSPPRPGCPDGIMQRIVESMHTGGVLHHAAAHRGCRSAPILALLVGGCRRGGHCSSQFRNNITLPF